MHNIELSDLAVTSDGQEGVTWDATLRSQILAEAIRIGEELLALAEHEVHGISWKTLSVDWQDNKQVRWRKSESIYSGVSGIALFFLELYKQTQVAAYLDTAVAAMNWVEYHCQNNPTTHFAFLTGRLGVAYTFLQMAQVTGQRAYLDKALGIARPCPAFLEARNLVDDFINGVSGAILALLHLHAATHERWILETIDHFIEHLLQRAQPGRVGLYWDRSFSNISGLCGFSHGAAGIGFVFLELGHYFQNEAFYWLAEQAFLYESHYFDPVKQNWPDLRKAIYEPHIYEEYTNAYIAGELSAFTQTKEINMWCHGAVGVGLSRLRAFELTQKSLYAQEARIAIHKTFVTDIEGGHAHLSPILCHGAGGNAELFLEAYKTFNDSACLTFARLAGARALAAKKQLKIYLSGYGEYAPQTEDISLFMGNAGVAYFYLKLLQPDVVPSLMLPRVTTTLGRRRHAAAPAEKFTSAYVSRQMTATMFARTLFVLERLAPAAVEEYFKVLGSNGRVSVKAAFLQFTENVQGMLPALARLLLSDALKLEKTMIEMEEDIPSHVLLHIKDQVQTQQASTWARLDDTHLLPLTLRCEPAVKVVCTNWSWALADAGQWQQNFNVAARNHYTLLKPVANGIFAAPLPPLAYAIVMAFQEAACIALVVAQIMQAMEVEGTAEADTAQTMILQQIRELIWAKILVATYATPP